MRFAGLILSMALMLGAGTALAEDCGAGQRLFSHRLLATPPVCVPEQPQRPAFIDSMIAAATALEIASVTSSYYSREMEQDFPGLAGRFTGTDIGNTWEMSGEPLLLAQPDLTVSSVYWEAANGFAEDIGPTVIIDPDKAQSWREVPMLVAELFGKVSEQRALDAALDTRLAAFNAALGAAESFIFVQVESPERLWVFTGRTFGPELMLEAGLVQSDRVLTPEQAAAVTGGGAFAYPVSLEQADTLDADHIFLHAMAGKDAKVLLESTEPGRRFVTGRGGKVHFITGQYWFNPNAFAAHRVLDELTANVAPDVVSPNPLAWAYQAE